MNALLIVCAASDDCCSYIILYMYVHLTVVRQFVRRSDISCWLSTVLHHNVLSGVTFWAVKVYCMYRYKVGMGLVIRVLVQVPYFNLCCAILQSCITDVWFENLLQSDHLYSSDHYNDMKTHCMACALLGISFILSLYQLDHRLIHTYTYSMYLPNLLPHMHICMD